MSVSKGVPVTTCVGYGQHTKNNSCVTHSSFADSEYDFCSIRNIFPSQFLFSVFIRLIQIFRPHTCISLILNGNETPSRDLSVSGHGRLVDFGFSVAQISKWQGEGAFLLPLYHLFQGLEPGGGGGTQVLNDYPLPNGRAERRQ